MKYLIVGLGNPGGEYENTRHNIGFKVLNGLLNNDDKFSNCKYGSLFELNYKSRKLLLLKPDTFMNLSGKAVNYWLQKEKIAIENLLVVTDDLSLNFSSLRLRSKGSDGGHNGLKNINDLLQTNSYPRLRIGIGNEFSKGRQTDYVLGNWSESESSGLQQLINDSCEVIKSFCSIGIDYTMSNLNRNK